MKLIRLIAGLFVFSVFLTGMPGRASSTITADKVTTYPEMIRELQQDQLQSSLIHLSYIGYSAASRRPIVMVQLGALKPKITRIMVLCRQHGDEPSGTEGALGLINDMARRVDAAKALQSVCLFVVPMVNPDGATAGTRLNGKGADLNRDWGIFHQSETVAVQRAVEQIHPAFILDVHSWDMIDPFQQICLEGPRQAQSAGNLLLPVADLQARAVYALGALTGKSVAATTFGTYSDANLAHRFFITHDHIASLLFETGPGANYGVSLKTRTAQVRTLLEWLIQDTSRHSDSWSRLIAAEPTWTDLPSITSPPFLAAHKAVARRRPIRWTVRLALLAAACLMILWISWKGKGPVTFAIVREAPRYRRLARTLAPTVSTYAKLDRKSRYRKSTERIIYLRELKRANGFSLNSNYPKPRQANAA